MALWTPDNLGTSPVSWLDANAIIGLSNNDSVTLWVDETGTGNDADQVSALYNPVYKTNVLNSQPIVRFAGSVLQFNSGSGFETTPAFTYFVIMSRTTTAQKPILAYSGGLYQFLDYTAWHIGPDDAVVTRPIDTPQIFVGQLVPGADGGKRWLDGTQEGSSIGAADSVGSHYNFLYLGSATTTGSFSGDIAEIVILDYVADTSTRQVIEGYLAWKWGLEGSLPIGHPYKLAAPEAGTNDIAYSASGGGIAGGIATQVSQRFVAMAGGGIAGGAAEIDSVPQFLALDMVGGAVAGGTVSYNQSRSLTSRRGAVAGGSSDAYSKMEYAGTSGGVVGGTSTIVYGFTHIATGGGVAAGEAIIEVPSTWLSFGGSIGFSGNISAFQWLNDITGAIGFSGNVSAYQEGSFSLIGALGFSGVIGTDQPNSLSLIGSLGLSGSFNAKQDERLSISGALGLSGEINIANQNLLSIIGELGFSSQIDLAIDGSSDYSLVTHNSTRWT